MSSLLATRRCLQGSSAYLGLRTSSVPPHPIIGEAKGIREIYAHSRKVSQGCEQGFLDETQTQKLQLWGSVTYRLGQFDINIGEPLTHSCHLRFAG